MLNPVNRTSFFRLISHLTCTLPWICDDFHMKQAVAYNRISSDSNKEKHGFTRQLDDVKSFADQHGFSISSVHNEVVSGTVLNRPELDKILESGCEVIICSDESRWARTPECFYALLHKASQRGIKVFSAKSGIEITNRQDPMGCLISGTMSLYANLERQEIIRKLRVARDASSDQLGHRCEGRKRYYNSDILKRVKQLRRKRGGKRMGCRVMARVLDSEGFETESGRKWCYSTVATLIKRCAC